MEISVWEEEQRLETLNTSHTPCGIWLAGSTVSALKVKGQIMARQI